ncbi:MAG: ferrous iron transport protein A [Ottowia sp.]|nr:ferrous iron transport protein A [Ottowia sp.]
MSTFPLTALPKGQTACIDCIAPSAEFGALDAEVSRRLSDLGFSNGMSVTVVSSGLRGHGPYAVRLGRSTQFALRRAEALKVQCRAA